MINDLNFKLEKGKFISLIGANGVRKSTLINTMIGIVKPLAGRINWQVGTDKKDPFNVANFSPQSQLIDGYINVFDNVIRDHF